MEEDKRQRRVAYEDKPEAKWWAEKNKNATLVRGEWVEERGEMVMGFIEKGWGDVLGQENGDTTWENNEQIGRNGQRNLFKYEKMNE